MIVVKTSDVVLALLVCAPLAILGTRLWLAERKEATKRLAASLARKKD